MKVFACSRSLRSAQSTVSMNSLRGRHTTTPQRQDAHGSDVDVLSPRNRTGHGPRPTGRASRNTYTAIPRRVRRAHGSWTDSPNRIASEPVSSGPAFIGGRFGVETVPARIFGIPLTTPCDAAGVVVLVSPSVPRPALTSYEKVSDTRRTDQAGQVARTPSGA